MAERPDDDRGKDYDWLYGRPDQPDDDATRRIPVTPRDPGDRGRRGGDAPSDEDERTRVMPAGDRSAMQPPAQSSAQSSAHPPARPPARPPGQPDRPRERRSRRRRPGRIVALVLALILAFFIGVPLWAWSQIEEVDAEPSGDRPPDTPGTTYLLVGSDSREGLTAEEKERLATGSVAGGRTDTIMLMHVPRFGGKTLLLSLPRDSIVEIPGYGEEKINAAYAYGGPELLVETVESETGLRMDSYVEIGLGGFANIVDAVGGVDICPSQPMQDPQAGLDIDQGCQEADGETALAYARSRKVSATGDIARVERQREVVSAIAAEAASPWTFLNPLRYVSLASAAAESIKIGEDDGPIDLARFAWGMTEVTGEDGLTCTVPIVDLAVHWDEEEAAALFEQIAEDDTDDIECSRTGGIG
ncbi:MAG TPA: LCP family protein [Nocardioidaceae bacterium]|nr:LCP family protein [Nocardioidaceae bacterium]